MTLKELKEKQIVLTRHDYRYYILCLPAITDQIYDKLDREFDDAVQVYLAEAVGKHTRSLETDNLYPDWVRKEFERVKNG